MREAETACKSCGWSLQRTATNRAMWRQAFTRAFTRDCRLTCQRTGLNSTAGFIGLDCAGSRISKRPFAGRSRSREADLRRPPPSFLGPASPIARVVSQRRREPRDDDSDIQAVDGHAAEGGERLAASLAPRKNCPALAQFLTATTTIMKTFTKPTSVFRTATPDSSPAGSIDNRHISVYGRSPWRRWDAATNERA